MQVKIQFNFPSELLSVHTYFIPLVRDSCHRNNGNRYYSLSVGSAVSVCFFLSTDIALVITAGMGTPIRRYPFELQKHYGNTPRNRQTSQLF